MIFALEGGRPHEFAGEARPERSQRSPHRLRFVVLIRFINGDSAEVFAHFEEVLIPVVPLGAGLVEKHASLVWPAELHKSSLADVGSELARVFHILVIVVLGSGYA